MKKWIFSLSLLLCASLSNSQDLTPNDYELAHDHAIAPKVLESSDARFIQPYTVNAGHLSVKGMDIQGFDAASMEKMEQAFAALEQVVNSEEFKNKILNFVNSKGKNQFASNNKLTNEQIYNQFMDGREMLQTNTPGEMNFFLKLYNENSKVVGWTRGDINTININWKFFKGFKPNEVAGNLAHEWTHKLGFGHKSAKQHDSAPYAIGYIVRELAARVLKGEELQ